MKSNTQIGVTVDTGDKGIAALGEDVNGEYNVMQLDSSGILRTSDEKLFFALRRLIDAALVSPSMDMATYRQRVTAILESTTLTTVSTVTALGTVGTTFIPQAQDMVLGANLSAWALCCRERIS